MSLRPGLFRRRECLVPTLRGWLVMMLVAGALTVGLVRGVYPFLAVNDPRPGGVLVVEGWSSDDAMHEVIAEFKRNSYDSIYSTGEPFEESSPLATYGTMAEYGAAVLIRLGCDPKVVHAVPTPQVVRDRTYASAVALKRCLQENNISTKAVNLYTVGAHSRRSRLLFQKVFGDEVQVGVVANKETDFDPRRWWTSSAGFRTVTSEIIAYCYARFLFHPPAE